MKIVMLIDNKSLNTNFATEHGLSLYIETDNKKILFDTGVSGNFIDNAIKMNINLADVDTVIISHAHKDHSGGLLRFLQLNTKAKIFMSSKVYNKYYAKMFCLSKNISMPMQNINKYMDRIIFIDEFTPLSDDIFLISKFLKPYPLLKTNRALFMKQGNRLLNDDFRHEIALVVKNHGKLVLISGCSHNGIENMIATLLQCFPEMKIQTVVGGFHLPDFPRCIWRESKENIKEIGSRLLSYEIEKIYTCHCTSERALTILQEIMGSNLEYLCTGMEVNL